MTSNAVVTIAISSRSLFHLEQANKIFEMQGQLAYDQYMLETANEPLEPGVAFPLVSRLLALNSPGKRDRVEVVLLSRNSSAASIRIMKSVQMLGLNIDRAAFTTGNNRFRYAKEFGADLFLCVTPSDAKSALNHGIASAIVAPGRSCDDVNQEDDDVVRLAFDGDSVLLSAEADEVYHSEGLDSFIASELANEHIPLGEGPFKALFAKLHTLRATLPPAKNGGSRLHIGLITARGVQSSGRVLNTLNAWGLSVDEMVFACGMPKGRLLRAFGAHFFFDDTSRNVDNAVANNIAAAQVPFGPGGIVASPIPAASIARSAAVKTAAIAVPHPRTAALVNKWLPEIQGWTDAVTKQLRRIPRPSLARIPKETSR